MTATITDPPINPARQRLRGAAAKQAKQKNSEPAPVSEPSTTPDVLEDTVSTETDITKPKPARKPNRTSEQRFQDDYAAGLKNVATAPQRIERLAADVARLTETLAKKTALLAEVEAGQAAALGNVRYLAGHPANGVTDFDAALAEAVQHYIDNPLPKPGRKPKAQDGDVQVDGQESFDA